MRDVESANGKYPERGQCLRDLFYVAVDGERKSISDFKGRSNLVVILTDNLDERLLDAIAQSYPEVTLREAHVITVLKCKATEAVHARDSRHWPFDVVADLEGALHREFGSENESGAVGMTVCITDRWAEVFFVCRTVDGDSAPDIKDVLEWLTFIDYQCPECFPSERPV
jgi:peroxiredoxin